MIGSITTVIMRQKVKKNEASVLGLTIPGSCFVSVIFTLIFSNCRYFRWNRKLLRVLDLQTDVPRVCDRFFEFSDRNLQKYINLRYGPSNLKAAMQLQKFISHIYETKIHQKKRVWKEIAPIFCGSWIFFLFNKFSKEWRKQSVKRHTDRCCDTKTIVSSSPLPGEKENLRESSTCRPL